MASRLFNKGDFLTRVYDEWRQVVDKEILPKMVTSHTGDGVFDPLTSFLVSHIHQPVCIDYSFPSEFTDVVVEALFTAFPALQPIVPYIEVPPYHGKPKSGEYCMLNPPMCVSFIKGNRFELAMYVREPDAGHLKTRFEDELKKSIQGKVCVVVSESDVRWYDRVSEFHDVPRLENVISNFPVETRREGEMIWNLVERGLRGEGMRGVTVVVLGSAGTGKTLFSLSLLEEVREMGVGFYLPYGHIGSRFFNFVEDVRGVLKDVPTMFVLDDADPILLSRLKHGNLLVLKLFEFIDNLPSKSVLVICSNLVSEIETALVRPGRVDYLFVIPPTGWGKSVFNFWCEREGLGDDDVVKLVLETDELRERLNKMTAAEVRQLVRVIAHRRKLLDTTFTVEGVRELMKSVVRWRKVYKEKPIEEEIL